MLFALKYQETFIQGVWWCEGLVSRQNGEAHCDAQHQPSCRVAQLHLTECNTGCRKGRLLWGQREKHISFSKYPLRHPHPWWVHSTSLLFLHGEHSYNFLLKCFLVSSRAQLKRTMCVFFKEIWRRMWCFKCVITSFYCLFVVFVPF